jgi:hypothetical protein
MDGLNLVWVKFGFGKFIFYIYQCFGPFANFGMKVYGLFFSFLWCLRFDKKKYKNMFLCVAYGQYPNMFLIFFLFKKNIWSFENVFSHGFFKHNKKG